MLVRSIVTVQAPSACFQSSHQTGSFRCPVRWDIEKFRPRTRFFSSLLVVRPGPAGSARAVAPGMHVSFRRLRVYSSAERILAPAAQLTRLPKANSQELQRHRRSLSSNQAKVPAGPSLPGMDGHSLPQMPTRSTGVATPSRSTAAKSRSPVRSITSSVPQFAHRTAPQVQMHRSPSPRMHTIRRPQRASVHFHRRRLHSTLPRRWLPDLPRQQPKSRAHTDLTG
jgi:hypothetical protein